MSASDGSWQSSASPWLPSFSRSCCPSSDPKLVVIPTGLFLLFFWLPRPSLRGICSSGGSHLLIVRCFPQLPLQVVREMPLDLGLARLTFGIELFCEQLALGWTHKIWFSPTILARLSCGNVMKSYDTF